MTSQPTRTLGVVLFPDFELLDVFGPLEMFGNMKGAVDIKMIAQRKAPVHSAQGPAAVIDHSLDDCPRLDLLLVPGGMGTRKEVDNPVMIDWLVRRVPETELAMTVCTGTSLFARAGVLDGRKATTNKLSFHWVAQQGPKVEWIKEARWVEDGKFFTSSGVSAGIDMSLAAISRIAGEQISNTLAMAAEYDWHQDSAWDPFAKMHGLV
jgi:transcriptional regulator GlxA family with amidase domain